MEEADASNDSSRIASVSMSQSGNDVDAQILRNRQKEQSFQQNQEKKEINWWGQPPHDEESEAVINDCEIANQDLLPDSIEEEHQPKVKEKNKFHDSSIYSTHQADRGSHIRRRGIPGRRGRMGRGASGQYHHRSEADITAPAPRPLQTRSTPKSEQDQVPRSDYKELLNKMAKIQERIKLKQSDLEEKEEELKRKDEELIRKDEELKRKDTELKEKDSIIKELKARWDEWGGKGFRRDRYAAKGFMNAEEASWVNLPMWKKKLLTKRIGDLVISLKGEGRVMAETLDLRGMRGPSPPPSNSSRPKKHSVYDYSERESLMQLDQGVKEREQSNPNSSPLGSCQKSEIEPRDANVPYKDRRNQEPAHELVSPPINYNWPSGGYEWNWQIPPGYYPQYHHPHGWSNLRYPGIPQNSPLLHRDPYQMVHTIRHQRPPPPQHQQYPPGRLQHPVPSVPLSEANCGARETETAVGYPNTVYNRMAPPINSPTIPVSRGR